MTRQVRCMRDAGEKFKVDNVLNVHYVYILCAHATLFNVLNVHYVQTPHMPHCSTLPEIL